MELSTAYKVLGLGPESNIDEARKAFDALVICWHPDRTKASLQTMANLKTVEATEAWNVVRRNLQSSTGATPYEPPPAPARIWTVPPVQNFCGNCGTKVIKGVRFCSACGRAQRPTWATETIAVPVMRELETPASSNAVAGPVQGKTQEPAGEPHVAEVPEWSSPVVPSISPTVAIVAQPGETPRYCRHNWFNRGLWGVEGEHGSETCRGCGLPYGPGSPSSHIHAIAQERNCNVASGEKPAPRSPKVLALMAAAVLVLGFGVFLVSRGSQGQADQGSGDAQTVACARVATITAQLADMREQMRLDMSREGAGSSAYFSTRQSLERQMEPLRVEMVVQNKVCKG